MLVLHDDRIIKQFAVTYFTGYRLFSLQIHKNNGNNYGASGII